MRLLVSVVDAGEARVVLDAGADVIDVKDPREGALGAPSPRVLREVAAVVGGARELSVALGDLPQLPHTAALAAAGAVACGASTVKLGLRGARDAGDAEAMLRAAVEAAGGAEVIGCGYADGGLGPDALCEAAARAGARGVLLDTFAKDGRGLLGWLTAGELRAFVRAAHERGLSAGLAGQLTLAQLGAVREAGADVAGVRSAVCAGGDRGARIDADRVSDAKVALCAT